MPSEALTTNMSHNHSATGRFEKRDPTFTMFQYIVEDLLLVLSLVATVFNIVVLLCAMRLFRKTQDTIHLFIFCMTIGDLILTMFCHPCELLVRKHEFLQQVHLCAVVSFFSWIGLAVSGLSLTLLNVDKLIYFRWPLHYERAMSKRGVLFCALIWILSIGFVAYVWIADVVYIHWYDCALHLRPGKKYYYEIFTIVFCVFPVLSSLSVSIYLFNLTRKKRNAIVARDAKGFKRKMKSLVFIFATTAWTSFSLLPYRIMNLGRIHFFVWGELSPEEQTILSWISWPLLYILTLNPIINPLITILIYAPYRLLIKGYLLYIPGNGHSGKSFRSSNFGSFSRSLPRRLTDEIKSTKRDSAATDSSAAAQQTN